jgi:phospholipase C
MWAVAFFGLTLSACNGTGINGAAPALPAGSQAGWLTHASALRMHRNSSSGKIQHIVIIVQENRSFNNLFRGYPGAKTAKFGRDTYGNKIKLLPVSIATPWDIDHSSNAFFAACNGTGSIPGTNCQMNGFAREWVGCGSRSNPCPIKHPQYAYVPKSQIKPYWTMAKQYVLSDEMYASNFDASSFISHQYIISGQALGAVNYPWGAWGCPGGSGDDIATVGPQRQIPYGYEVVCWDPTTLGDELDTANQSWAFYGQYYSGYPWLWIAYQAINHIYYGQDWNKDIIHQPSQFITDVQNGQLRAVTWVTPSWQNSDHAGSNSTSGPSWVASVVNAIGQSSFWNSTAIFIFWDDYGGWYDSEPPAYVDYDGLGLRLPLLIVSPYAKQGYVSHTHYEHGTILKFVEETFGLPALAASDSRANPPDDSFDFSQPPRKFKVIPSTFGKDYFLHQAPDYHIPDAE